MTINADFFLNLYSIQIPIYSTWIPLSSMYKINSLLPPRQAHWEWFKSKLSLMIISSFTSPINFKLTKKKNLGFKFKSNTYNQTSKIKLQHFLTKN